MARPRISSFLFAAFLFSSLGNPYSTFADRPATLADMWAGRANFRLQDGDSFGSNFHMHFISTVWNNGVLYAYYIFSEGKDSNGLPLQSIGLATSSDGISFTDLGKVLPRGGTGDYVFNTISSFQHSVGRQDASCGGWSASASSDATGFLAYGPYVRGLRTGILTAQFRLTIDAVNSTNDIVATVDVYDSVNSPSLPLAQKSIRRSDFAPNTKELLVQLPFSNPSNSLLEMRTYYESL